MRRYFHLDTAAVNGEDTNLQLYSLRKARRNWAKLVRDYAEYGDDTDYLRERCVFVLATLGLSISQLLGQNDPSVGADVRYPIQIFNAFVDAHGLDADLKRQFERFNYFYNGCRHFGKTTTGKGYKRIEEVTFPVARECYEFGLTVWRTVIGVYRDEVGNELDDLDVDELTRIPNKAIDSDEE